MDLDASSYIVHRKSSKTALTDKRINEIITYVVDCYLQFKKDNVSISKKEMGKIAPEDYYRNILVDNYLRKNRRLLNSSTTEINFNKESTETYEDSNGVKHDDKIDIHISDLALQKSWSSSGDVYFAIECKRLKVLSDTTEYVKDIKKFTERKYTSTRLPYEGQIAFVENPKLLISNITDEVNRKLINHESIKTNQYLELSKIHAIFDGTCSSNHTRNQTDEKFMINHLFFDYSNVLIN